MAKESTKVVVRLLPPLITEDELLSTINEEHIKNAKLRTFIEGKRHKKDKPSQNATCYLYFGATDHADAFIRDYHGHQFVDDQGEQYRAVACFAPYQKVPKTRGKDAREGTIEEDPAYQEFVEGLTKTKEAYVGPENPKFADRPAPGTTPLLLFMANKAKERRARLDKRQKDKQRWWPEGDSIPEDDSGGKKSKWRCGECGTTKKLEEDPDDRGQFYCTGCWEYWEVKAEKKKKKKKKTMYEEEEAYEEPTSRKGRKKKEKEAAAAADWYGTEDAEADGKRARRKKKDKEANSWGEEGWGESSWADSGWGEASGKKEKKKSKKDRGDEKWVEKPTKADDGQGAGSRWRPKGESAESEAVTEGKEKSRRSRKDRRDDSWWS